MFDKKMWDDTRDLMDFVEDGVVPKIYEYGSKQYPVWEKASKNNNVWLISKIKLSDEDHKGSYPHLRAEGNGYYIYGFRYSLDKLGQARGEFFRYMAEKRCLPEEWNIYDCNGEKIC